MEVANWIAQFYFFHFFQWPIASEVTINVVDALTL